MPITTCQQSSGSPGSNRNKGNFVYMRMAGILTPSLASEADGSVSINSGLRFYEGVGEFGIF